MAKTLLWVFVIVNMLVTPILGYFVNGSYTFGILEKIMIWLVISVLAICEAIETVAKKVKR